jgi:hypothetical protein
MHEPLYCVVQKLKEGKSPFIQGFIHQKVAALETSDKSILLPVSDFKYNTKIAD